QLIWASDSYADDVPFQVNLPLERDVPEPKCLLRVPYSHDCNDFKFHVIGGGFADPDRFSAHMKNASDVPNEEREMGIPKMMTVRLHCRILRRPGRFGALKKFVEYFGQKDGV
ncbi:uncharacterized protein BDR25DRAFT_242383, partial [Lindgomyces ingoldianus]